MLSSPDPLASSDGEHRVGSRAVTPIPQANSSSRKSNASRHHTRRQSQERRISYEYGTVISSPGRTVSEQTLSPWKIRVTVEAEPEDESALMEVNPRTTTRTTKIPLRDSSSPTAARPGRGRSNSATRSSPKKKRSGTPVRTGRRRSSVTDLDARPLGDDDSADDWEKSSKKRSPKKKSSKARSRQSTPEMELSHHPQDSMVEAPDGLCTDEQILSPELRSLDMNNVSVRTRPQTVIKPRPDSPPSNIHPRPATSTRKPMPGRMTDRKISINSALSYPTPSPEPDDPQNNSIDNDGDLLETSESLQEAGNPEGPFDTIMESEGFTMIDLETLPSVKEYFSSPNETGVSVPGDVPLLKDDSLSPHQNSTATDKDGDAIRSRQLPAVRYPTLSHLDETDLSSNVPSSPPETYQPATTKSSRTPGVSSSLLQPPSSSTRTNHGHRKVTPLPQLSSPSLPSPPAPPKPAPQKKGHQHRKSASAVFAGIALQDVVSPASSATGRDLGQDRVIGGQKRSDVVIGTPTNVGDDGDESGIFRGFDASTKRELRMGLRFGEELAKRAGNSDQATSARAKEGPNRTAPEIQSKVKANVPSIRGTEVWRGETLVRHSPIPGTGYNAPNRAEIKTPEPKTNENEGFAHLNTTVRREREWAAERAAVVKEIRAADSSQVIVIDTSDVELEDGADDHDHAGAGYSVESEPIGASVDQEDQEDDGEVGGDDDTDIWLEEARENSSSSPAHEASGQQQDVASEVFPASRPKRRLIPSPWKRGEDIENSAMSSSIEFTGLDYSSGRSSGVGSSVPEDSRLKFGAGRIQRGVFGQEVPTTRRGSSGRFDIDLMATPRRVTLDRPNDTAAEGSQDDGPEPEEPADEASGSVEEMDFHPNSSMASEGQLPDQSSRKIPLKLPPAELSSPLSSEVEHASRFGSHSQPRLTPPPEPAPQASPPRSAMKGSRQSFVPQDECEGTPSVARRVIWSQRNRGIDEMGIESSFSMGTGTSSILSEDSVQQQLRMEQEAYGRDVDAMDLDEAEEESTPTREERQAPVGVSAAPVAAESNVQDEEPAATGDNSSVASPQQQPTASGWKNWIFGASSEPAEASTPSDSPIPQGPPPTQERQESEWKQTKSAIPSTSQSRSHASHQQPVPQYLLPPSYPSDPKRNPSKRLRTSGAFSNTHFRTLHIIHAKSLRPRFHAPSTIRPELQSLRGTILEIDESETLADVEDAGVFEWALGDRECAVLERFMQEVEWGYGYFRGGGSGDAELGTVVQWGWSADELARWYCRIVVGEVVREAEDREREAQGRLKRGG